MHKFRYEIILNVEEEIATLSGQLFFASTPSVKRKPSGWRAERCYWGANRVLAKSDIQTHKYDCSEQVLRRMRRHNVPFTIRRETRMEVAYFWVNGSYTPVTFPPTDYWIIENLGGY